MPKILGIPKVRFNLIPAKDGEAYIVLVLRYNNQVLRYGVGAKLKAKQWDSKAQRAKYAGNNDALVEVNRLLNDLENLVTQIYIETTGQISPEDFRKEILYRTGQVERPAEEIQRLPTLPEFAAQFVGERQNSLTGKRGTWKVLLTVSNYLSEFAQDQSARLAFDEIDHNFAHGFTNWMYSPPREFSANYAAKVLSVVRQFMREAQRRKLHSNTAYTGFSIKKEKVTHIALTFDELDTLFNLDLSGNERLERVRDLFLIGCYTGLRYSDFNRIEPGHVIEEQGEKMLEITTQKTGEHVVIPFLPEAADLLAKYHYNPPRISSQKMNDYLKELCRLAGMTETVRVVVNKAGKRQEVDLEKCDLITTHVARRSFATNLYLLGVPAINIMKITGHATEKQFMGYICIDGRLNAQNMAKQIAMRRGQRYLRKAE